MPSDGVQFSAREFLKPKTEDGGSGMGRPRIENNIHHIARLAGVSISTVSRVVNHPEAVCPKTAARVKEAMNSVNYAVAERAPRPKAPLRNVVFVMGNSYEEISIFPRMIEGIINVLRTQQIYLTTYIQTESDSVAEDIIAFAMDKRAEGIILATRIPGEKLSALQAHFPCVQCFEHTINADCPYVSTDFRKAIAKMMNHLFSLGRSQIAFVSLIDECGYTAAQRRDAYLQNMREQGLQVAPDWVVQLTPPVSFDHAMAAGMRLLTGSARPDAVICTSDVFASAIIRAAQTLGIQVPEDVVVVGGDNSVASKISSPMITTIHHPVYEIGYAVGEMMLGMIQHPDEVQNRHMLLDAELILRASSDVKK